MGLGAATFLLSGRFFFGVLMKFRNKTIKKKYIILSSLLVLFFIGRATLPGYLHKKTNEYLSNVSPDFSLQIQDFDLSVIRMAYRFEGVTAKLKKDKGKKEFLNIKKIYIFLKFYRSLKFLYHLINS